MSVTFEGLEQAREEFNKWQGHAIIVLDFDNRTAWCDVFASDNEWIEYQASIFKLVGKDSLLGRDDKYSLTVLEKLAEAKYQDHQEGREAWQINDNYCYSEIIYRYQ